MVMIAALLILLGLAALYAAWRWALACPKGCMADDLKSGKTY